MNAPIQGLYSTGQNLYAVLISNVNGYVWNQQDSAWEAYDAGHWSQYAIAMTEYSGSGYYRVAYPIASPTILSTDLVFVRGGGSPALGDSPAAAPYQSQGVNVGAVGNSWQAGQNMGLALGTQQVGIVGASPTATVITTNLTNDEDDAYAGRAIIMTSGDLIQQASPITGYDGTTFDLTITGFPSGLTPTAADTFIII